MPPIYNTMITHRRRGLLVIFVVPVPNIIMTGVGTSAITSIATGSAVDEASIATSTIYATNEDV